MDELSAILSAWRGRRDEPGNAVMATLVHVEGSAYRRPGARMLICGDGSCVGSVSGGCLEGDVTHRAAWWTPDGEAVLRIFDASSEEASWEFGLGCDGVITLLLERIANRAADEALAFLDSQRQARSGCVVALAIRAAEGCGFSAGDRLLWNNCGVQGGALAGSRLEARLAAEAATAARERTSRLVHLDEADVFVEFAGPPQRLIVFGAGHGVVPLSAMAAQMGWRVTIADERPGYANPMRFLDAERVVVLPPNGDISEIEIDCDSAVVLMTQSPDQDRRLLPQILARRPKYLGLPGSKQGGSESPAAVALSIVSEVMAVSEGRTGGPLKRRRARSHSAVRTHRASRATRDDRVELTLCGNRV